MDSLVNRRAILGGMITLVAAPAIVRASSLMPVKSFREIFVGMDCVLTSPDGSSGEYTVVSVMERINGVFHVKAIEFDHSVGTRTEIEMRLREFYGSVGDRFVISR